MPLVDTQTTETQPEEAERKALVEATTPDSSLEQTVTPDADAAVRLFSDKRLRTRKGAMVWLWTAFSPLVALATLINILNGDWNWTVFGLMFLATAYTMNRLVAELDRAQVALQTNLDKSWIGALVDALEWPNRRIRGIARHYLVRLLPTLREADANLLEEAQRDILYGRLTPRAVVKDPPLTLAILKALEQIGDGGAVSHVARLAKMSAFTLRRDTVREAARACLPALERRVLKQRLAAAAEEAQATLPLAAGASVTPEQTPIEAHVSEQMKTLEAASRTAQPGMRPIFLAGYWGIVFPYTAIQAGIGVMQHNWLHALIFGCLALVTTQMHRLTLNQKHQALIRFLAGLENVEAVGPLAEALDWPDPQMRHVAIRALTRLLPKLRASDAALLNPQQRAALYRMLTLTNATAHGKFLEALLKALEQVGDEAAIPWVENLANSRPLTSQQQKVCEAALACLPYLQEQAKQNTYSQTLLRAASASDIPVETLLRPVSGPQDVEPAYLLRADTTERS